MIYRLDTAAVAREVTFGEYTFPIEAFEIISESALSQRVLTDGETSCEVFGAKDCGISLSFRIPRSDGAALDALFAAQRARTPFDFALEGLSFENARIVRIHADAKPCAHVTECTLLLRGQWKGE